MSRTGTLKSYGETLVDTGRTGLLAAIGAGDAAVDVAVDRARSVLGTVRSRAEALPGEAQVQADLAAKEARARAEQARAAVSTVRPESVLGSVTGLVESARTQALAAIGDLAERGEKIVGELRTQPAFRRVVARTERAVDSVEDTVEDVLEETAETVASASDEVTSVAQMAKARTDKAVDRATEETREAAESTKRTVRSSAEASPAQADEVTVTAPKKPAAKKTPTAKKPSASSPVPDPTAVPAKRSTPAS